MRGRWEARGDRREWYWHQYHSYYWYLYWYTAHMPKTRKITVEVPEALLEKAREATGEGVTSTIRRGLELVAASRPLDDLRKLRGKVRFTIDLDELRMDRP